MCTCPRWILYGLTMSCVQLLLLLLLPLLLPLLMPVLLVVLVAVWSLCTFVETDSERSQHAMSPSVDDVTTEFLPQKRACDTAPLCQLRRLRGSTLQPQDNKPSVQQ